MDEQIAGPITGVVDSHVHLFPPEIVADPGLVTDREPYFALLYQDPRRRLWDAPSLLEAMDRDGISRSVAVNFGWQHLELSRRTNAYLLEVAARHPDRIAVCVTSPPFGGAALAELESALRAGAAGIGEFMPDGQGFAIDSEFGDSIAAFARQFDVPLLLHASEPVGHRYPGKGATTPDRLAALIERHPLTRFVLAHVGGGLPFYALMPEVRRGLDRVWYDGAAAVFLYEPAVYRRVIDLVGADRVLFASDAPLVSARRALDHLMAAGLDAVEQELVVTRNALRVYFGRSL